jgi:diacylglycerol kinase (ATP)
VITLKHTAKWRVLFTAIKAAVRGLGEQPTARHYRFTTRKPLPLQLDGELVTLDPGTEVSVDVVPGALATIH